MDMNKFDQVFTLPKLIRFAIPSIIMQMFLSMYTIVDGTFISRYAGTVPLSSLNMFYPIINVAWAISIMLAVGGSAYISKELGEQNFKQARNDFSFLAFFTVLISIVSAIFIFIFRDGLVSFLGVSEVQYPHGMTYLNIHLLFFPMLFLQVFFQSFFITAGKPGLGLFSTIIGGLSNMLLDYVFVGLLNQGIAGAAYATCIGFCIPSIIGLIYFSINRNGLLYFVPFQSNPKMLLKSCTNGSSEMVTNIAIAITCLLFNLKFMEYKGEDGVAALCIVYYLQYLFIALFFGYSMGVSPILAYKYGAKDKKQIHSITHTSICLIALVSIVAFILSLVSIPYLLNIFTKSDTVRQIVLDGFLYYAISFLFIGLNANASALFTALQNGKISAILSFGRTFVFLIICIEVLSHFFGVNGLWASTSVAETLGFGLSLYYFFKYKNTYGY